MHLISSIKDYKVDEKPTILTIGNFDGVHRGHMAVLQAAKHFAGKEGRIVVITFSNHPSEILRPQEPPVLRLCTQSHKINLLSSFGVHTLITIPFTKWLANHSAASFIEHIRESIPFTHLVLGHDATLGKDRQGRPATMVELGEQWGFEVHYLEEFRYEGHPVSSTKIRHLIQHGDLHKVENFLGRPYSIYSLVTPGEQMGKAHGLPPTANIDVTELCLPPLGVYAVQLVKGRQKFRGIANLGAAPTMHVNREVQLEVHLFDFNQNLYNENVEVIFQQFIRPEMIFSSIAALKDQITLDIDNAKNPLLDV